MNPQDVFFITTSSIIALFVHLRHWGFPTLCFCCKKKSSLLLQVAHAKGKCIFICLRGKQPATHFENPLWSASSSTSLSQSALAGLSPSQGSHFHEIHENYFLDFIINYFCTSNILLSFACFKISYKWNCNVCIILWLVFFAQCCTYHIYSLVLLVIHQFALLFSISMCKAKNITKF